MRGKSWGGQHKFNHPPPLEIKDGDIFLVDSPKAYAPLGYGTPSDPVAIRPEDFKNDIPLPSYGTFFFPNRKCLVYLISNYEYRGASAIEG